MTQQNPASPDGEWVSVPREWLDELAYFRVKDVRGSNDVPAFDLCVKSEVNLMLEALASAPRPDAVVYRGRSKPMPYPEDDLPRPDADAKLAEYDELASLKNDLAVERRKMLFLQWKLIEVRAEGIKEPKDRAAEIAKAKAALKDLGDPALERKVEDAATHIVSLEKTASEALQECERLRVIASDAWDAIIFCSDKADLMPDRVAELLERIRPYRALGADTLSNPKPGE